MTVVMEAPAAQVDYRWSDEVFQSYERELSPADEVAANVLAEAEDVKRNLAEFRQLGLLETHVTEVEVPGPHRLVVLDESVQPGGAYKYYSALYAAWLAKRQGAREVSTGTAGNFGKTLAEATRRLGLDMVGFAPRGSSQVKRNGMSDNGARVVVAGRNVEKSIEVSENYAAKVRGTIALHPYDSMHNFAALTLMADRVVDGLNKMDLSGYEVEGDMQLGGGSGARAMAVKFNAARQAGLLPERTRLHVVRPVPEADGSPNKNFDGLAVVNIGKNAQTLIEDERYVQAVDAVTEPEVAEAARFAFQKFGVHYEPPALAGLASALARMKRAEQPTVYVVVLTGRNVSEEHRDYFMQMPGPKEQAEIERLSRAAVARQAFLALSADYASREVSGVDEVRNWQVSHKSRVGRTVLSPLLSGYTAHVRAGLVEPKPRTHR